MNELKKCSGQEGYLPQVQQEMDCVQESKRRRLHMSPLCSQAQKEDKLDIFDKLADKLLEDKYGSIVCKYLMLVIVAYFSWQVVRGLLG